MDNLFLYPGRGKQLRKAAAGTGNQVSEEFSIPASGFSEIVNFHEGLEGLFEFVFAASPTGDILIEKVATPTAEVTGSTYATVTATGLLSVNWNAGKTLIGSFRIKNTTNQSVSIFYNNRVR
jgi:hypothetical protein